MDLIELYRQMQRARAYELAVAELWNQGLIAGEMHLGTGEEGVAAGVVAWLEDGDGLALTHRCSPALVARGVPLVPMLRELLGRDDGLCGGRGGHMHLYSRPHLAATSGIVGASLPTAAGFALANTRLRPRRAAVAFTGTGAMNQGMALETLNLAVVWKLPLLVVCIDNGWAITTTSEAVTGGDLVDRARAFGLETERVDGRDVAAVAKTAGKLLDRVRAGFPAFMLAPCPRFDGHFLGDPLLKMSHNPIAEGRGVFGQVLESAVARRGGSVRERAGGAARMMAVLAKARRGPAHGSAADPLTVAKRQLKRFPEQVERVEREVAAEIEGAVADALADAPEASDA